MEQIDQTLAALANPTRRQIVSHLASGPASVLEIVEQFELTQPTISSHIRRLEQAGVVIRSKRGQTRPVALNPQSLIGLGTWLGQIRGIYEENFKRLDTVLEMLKDKEEG